jgi:hypothetical protein
MRVLALSSAFIMLAAHTSFAQTTSFPEYVAMDEAGQSRVVNNGLARIFDGYQRQGREQVGQCMVELFLTAPTTGGLPTGYIEFAKTISVLKQTENLPEDLPSIERILFNVVSAECVEAAAQE